MSASSRVLLWLPPPALMGLIFFFSAQPDLTSGLGLIDLIGRKLIHAGEYALLCFLWWRALASVVARPRALAGAVAVCVVYAMTDEYHQTFVEGRNGSALDVLIDTAGATAAAAVIRSRGRAAVQ